MPLEDRLAISDLLVRYASALDAGDVATVVDCFTGDATLESPVIGVIAGRGAIRAFAERFAAQRQRGMQFRHMVTNICRRDCAGGRSGAGDRLPPGIDHAGRQKPHAAARPLRMRGGQDRRCVAFQPPGSLPRPRLHAGGDLRRPSLCLPGESRDPPPPWIPAFAGMTNLCVSSYQPGQDLLGHHDKGLVAERCA